MEKCELVLRVEYKQELFNIYNPFEQLSKLEYCFRFFEVEQPDHWRYQNQIEIDGTIGAFKDENGDCRERKKKWCKNENCTKCNEAIASFESPRSVIDQSRVEDCKFRTNEMQPNFLTFIFCFLMLMHLEK